MVFKKKEPVESMRNQIDRKYLETAIEKQVYNYVQVLKESMYDDVMIYLNKKNIDMDRQVADALLQIVKASIETLSISKMDHFLQGLDTALTQCLDQENPFQPGKQ